MKQLAQKDKEILEVLAEYPQGLFLAQIQRYARITSLQNAWKYCVKLIDKGYIRKDGKLYKTTSKHLTISAEAPRLLHETVKSTPTQNQPAQIRTRAHKLGLSYPLLSPLAPDQPQQLFQMEGSEQRTITLRNNQQAILKIGRITAKLTTKHLELYTKDIYTDNRSLSIELEDAIKEEFDRLAQEIEQRANIKLKRLKKGVFKTYITAQHYAEENHPFAEQAPSSPLILAASPIDNQRRLGVDQSKGFREWEYYHRLSAGTDKDTGDSQFNGVLDGKIDLWDIPELKEGLKEVGSLLEQTAKSQSITQNQLNYYAENLAAHSQAIKNLNENTLKNSMTIDKLNIVLDKINTSLSEQPTPKPSWLGRLLGRKPKG